MYLLDDGFYIVPKIEGTSANQRAIENPLKDRIHMHELESADLDNVSSISSINQTVSSLCPICLKIINARIIEEENAVMLEKRCEEHGDYRDVYWSDATLYRRFISYQSDGSGHRQFAAKP